MVLFTKGFGVDGVFVSIGSKVFITMETGEIVEGKLLKGSNKEAVVMTTELTRIIETSAIMDMREVIDEE